MERALEKEDDDDDRGRLWPFGRAKCRPSRRRRDAVYLRPCDGTSVGSPHRCVPRFFPFHTRLIRHDSSRPHVERRVYSPRRFSSKKYVETIVNADSKCREEAKMASVSVFLDAFASSRFSRFSARIVEN